jgi:2-keto-4-pentenoate hydratase/2-oxohepta-3-ene-1,7-dioic acid hydratase in catechol pathway
MRLIRFSTPGGDVRTGIQEAEYVRDLGDIDPLNAAMRDIHQSTPLLKFDELTLQVPLRQVSKIMALAGNYRKHAEEAGLAIPSKGIVTPQVFWKPSTTLLRHGGTVPLRKKNVFSTGKQNSVS